jgi:hypothetical protein
MPSLRSVIWASPFGPPAPIKGSSEDFEREFAADYDGLKPPSATSELPGIRAHRFSRWLASIAVAIEAALHKGLKRGRVAFTSS